MIKRTILFALILIMISGCRGWRSEKPPVHPNINFDFQPRFKAQTNPMPIPDNTTQYSAESDSLSLKNYSINESFIKNGQKNYNIYCSACHTKTGNGTKSVVSQNGWIASNILESVTMQKNDNEIFNIIKHGIRSMPGYGKKLSNEEVWQVVLYVRALQKIETATPSEKKRVRKTNDS